MATAVNATPPLAASSAQSTRAVESSRARHRRSVSAGTGGAVAFGNAALGRTTRSTVFHACHK